MIIYLTTKRLFKFSFDAKKKESLSSR